MLQPQGSVIQLCHVVRDMQSAIRYWNVQFGAGPFFLGDMEMLENQFYRGRPAQVSLEVAFTFSGGLMIELVRPIRDIPSVFGEVLNSSGPGYHHVMYRQDYDVAHAKLTSAGFEAAFVGQMPGGERCALFDTRCDSGGFVEIMDLSDPLLAQIDRMATAHQRWDGQTRLIRPMAESFGI
jgi:Glyoxalase/Bleomycin resistance protein/Dioxygenase superfamily